MYAQGGILNEMKNTKKISIMSGLVTIGVLLCGVHIANAQTNIDSGYTITIPSEVGIDKDSGKGSFYTFSTASFNSPEIAHYGK